MKKRIFFIVLAAALSLTCCGKDETVNTGAETESESATTQNQQPEPETTPVIVDTTRAAVVDDFSGAASATQNGANVPVVKGMKLLRQDGVNTAAETWVSLELTDRWTVLAEENTDIQITRLTDDTDKNIGITVSNGKVWAYIDDGASDAESLTVQTPKLALVTRDARFYTDVNGDITSICLFEGEAEVKAQSAGGGALADADGNPVALTLTEGSFVRVSADGDTITEVAQGRLNMDDIAPFNDANGAGPGGVYDRLRGQLDEMLWKETVLSFGRSRENSQSSNSVYSYKNYCGGVIADLNASYPQGTDPHGYDNLNDFFFNGKVNDFSLYITDSGTMDYAIRLTGDDRVMSAGYLDVYQGALSGSNIEYTRVQEERSMNQDVTMRFSGMGHWIYLILYNNNSYSYGYGDYLVISTADANTFLETGVLPGYENAPFLEELRETLQYTYKATALVTPDGEPVSFPEPEPGVVTAYGRPGVSVDISSNYTYSAVYSAGTLTTGLTRSFPNGAGLLPTAAYNIGADYINENIFPSRKVDLTDVVLVITEDGTFSTDGLVFGKDSIFTDNGAYMFTGTLTDGNVAFELSQSEADEPVSLMAPSGFSYRFFFRTNEEGTYTYSGRYYFTISTADANAFMETGAVPGYDGLPDVFLDSLREELFYAYKVIEPSPR